LKVESWRFDLPQDDKPAGGTTGFPSFAKLLPPESLLLIAGW
jgi:hypothetical protein